MTAATLLTGLAPVHPGEILREDVLPALGKSKAEIARILGTSRQSLYDLLAEKQGVTIPMALRLGKMCGNGGQFWFALQTAYDMRKAETELADALERIPTLTAA
jgi:addiction module HigA family antidote